MLLTTLESHARHIVENPEIVGGIGDDLFILEGIAFDKDAWQTQLAGFDPTKGKARPAKFKPRIVLRGTKAHGRTFTNAGSRGANAKSATVGSLPNPEPLFDPPQPNQELSDFWKQLADIQQMEPKRFAKDAASALTVIRAKNAAELREKVRGAAIVPYPCQAADSFCYPLLALHSLNQQAALLGLQTEESLLSPEILRFLVLFWAFHASQAKNLQFLHNGYPVKMERPEIVAAGTLGDIRKLIISISTGGGLLGIQKPGKSPVLEAFHSILGDELSSIKFDNRPYSTAPTGISPTNSFKNQKGSPALSPNLVLGTERQEIEDLMPGYGPLLTGTRFALDGELFYYVLPEHPRDTDLGRFLKMIRRFLDRVKSLKEEYFKCFSSKKTRDEALERWKKAEESFWENQWADFNITNLLFAIEKNVGSSNQQSFAWIQVHKGVNANHTFLLLRALNDPQELPRLIGFLKSIQEGRTLGAGWVSGELRALIASFFKTSRTNTPQLDYEKLWVAWRGYFTRSNTSSHPFESSAWEHAMRCVLKLNAIHTINFDDLSTGKALFNQYKKAMNQRDDESEKEIDAYLRERFLTDDSDPRGNEKLTKWIEDRAKAYSRFVDTSSAQWKGIVDGLIVGWGLQRICKSLRSQSEDYKQLVGGKGLARFTPAELRSLMLDLRDKAERAGRRPWNIDVPIEQLFLWSQKNPFSPEVTVFMDSVALGFHRFEPYTGPVKTTE